MKKFVKQEVVGIVQLDNQTFHGFYRVQKVTKTRVKLASVDTAAAPRVFSLATGNECWETLRGHGLSRIVDCEDACVKYKNFIRRTPPPVIKS